jgi:hypothetical protein
VIYWIMFGMIALFVGLLAYLWNSTPAEDDPTEIYDPME